MVHSPESLKHLPIRHLQKLSKPSNQAKPSHSPESGLIRPSWASFAEWELSSIEYLQSFAKIVSFEYQKAFELCEALGGDL